MIRSPRRERSENEFGGFGRFCRVHDVTVILEIAVGTIAVILGNLVTVNGL